MDIIDLNKVKFDILINTNILYKYKKKRLLFRDSLL